MADECDSFLFCEFLNDCFGANESYITEN